jgi:gamma-glutamyl-gamma-aminobutyrate hydrolase PuuD
MPTRIAVACRNVAKAKPYELALASVGLEPVTVTPGAPHDMQGFGGLLLTGGADVNPARYNQPRGSRTQQPDDERDSMEIALLTEALAADTPVLAICRGIQLLNVALGGTLAQHVEGHGVVTDDRGAPAHEVMVYSGTRLAAILHSGPAHVNSRHHQAVADPAPGLVVSARSTRDGVIEAVEHTCKRFVLGVQWHPEDQVDTQLAQKRLFEAFARAVGVTGDGCGSVR